MAQQNLSIKEKVALKKKLKAEEEAKKQVAGP
jgi:hypothetical protein